MQIHTEIDTPTEHDAADLELAKKIYDILDKHYSGHPWGVWADHREKNGTCDIKLFYPDAKGQIWHYGYKLHIGKCDTPFLKKKVVKAGGELLERYGLPRERANINSALDAKNHGLDRTL